MNGAIRTLILPGIGDSGAGHWQSLWQAERPDFIRVAQRDWENAVCAEWVDNLERAVSQGDGNVVLVAHSLGCLLVAHWAAKTNRKIQGALLVAPPDPAAVAAAEIFSRMTRGFLPFPTLPFDFPSIVVASCDDPYGGLDFSRRCASAWGSRFVDVGAAGHINADSGIGAWPDGYELYRQLAA